MWNKFLLILAVVSLTISLSAQQYRATRRSRGRQTTTTVQQKTTAVKKTTAQPTSAKSSMNASARQSGRSAKFDPKKPALTQSQIDYVMNGQIQKKLLELKLPAKLPGSKNDDEDTSEDENKAEADEKKDADEKKAKPTYISRLDFASLMSEYNSLTANFELIEVTHIRQEWYQQYRTELLKFGAFVNEMTIALRTRSNGRYTAAMQKFKEHQKACLKFLKAKPPRITKEQYEALVLKNTKIRQQNYLKKLKEEREAAMKRRQEMLKQLQQKNQQKMQGQTTAPRAEKKK